MMEVTHHPATRGVCRSAFGKRARTQTRRTQCPRTGYATSWATGSSCGRTRSGTFYEGVPATVW